MKHNKHNYKYLIIPIMVIIVISMFSSCGRILYGTSTKVNVESNINGDSVDIIALGPKKVVEYHNVSLPYKMKVKHNNLPLQVNILSKKYDYGKFEINAEHKFPVGGKIIMWTGYVPLFASFPLYLAQIIEDETPELAIAATGMLLGGLSLTALGNSFSQYVPEKESYYTMADTINTYTYYKTTDVCRRELVTKEIYKCLDSEYDVINGHNYIDWLQENDIKIYGKHSAESHYLRGLIYLKDDYLKKAQKEFNTAIELIDVSGNPGLYDNIVDCVLEVEEIRRQKRERRAEIWTGVASMVLQTGVAAYQTYAQAEYTNNMQKRGVTPSGVVTDPSKISSSDLSPLLDPRFAAQQVYAREYAEYLEFCRYNKREDGSNYSFYDFQAYKGQLLLNLKEQGIDLVAEQKELNTKLRQQMREERAKDTERRFKEMGYNYTSHISNSSNSSTSTKNTSSNTTNNKINSTSVSNQTNIIYSTEKDLDSNEQYRRDPVASEDYQEIRKDITLYYRDGDNALEYKRNVTLYKKGSNYYIKLDNTFYPRRAPNWLRFRNMIHYRDGLYYND